MPVTDDTFAFRRDLPHLQKLGKTYFITFCSWNRSVLSVGSRDIVLATCVRDHRVAYWLHCVVVMPDHVHVILTPFDGYDLSTIMSRIKSISAHRINGRGHVGHVWQREYFDRIVRASEDLRRKIEYVCANPVRAGLAEDYKWVWKSWDAAEGGGAPQS